MCAFFSFSAISWNNLCHFNHLWLLLPLFRCCCFYFSISERGVFNDIINKMAIKNARFVVVFAAGDMNWYNTSFSTILTPAVFQKGGFRVIEVWIGFIWRRTDQSIEHLMKRWRITFKSADFIQLSFVDCHYSEHLAMTFLLQKQRSANLKAKCKWQNWKKSIKSKISRSATTALEFINY